MRRFWQGRVEGEMSVLGNEMQLPDFRQLHRRTAWKGRQALRVRADARRPFMLFL